MVDGGKYKVIGQKNECGRRPLIVRRVSDILSGGHAEAPGSWCCRD